MNKSRLLVVGSTSATLVGLELVWTRIFSAEFFYTYAFLTISLAILGLGLGGLALRLFGDSRRRVTLGGALTASAILCLVGPPAVFRLGLDFSRLSSSWGMLGKFVVTLALLAAPFFFGGMALAMLFKERPRQIPQLYMADLLGAGAGVLAVIMAMNWLGTPATVFWTPLPMLVAGLVVSRGWWKIAPTTALVGAALLARGGETLLELPREERAPVIYRHWDAMAKIKVYDVGGQFRRLNIDNVANSPLIPFDGNWDPVYDYARQSGWPIDVGYLISLFDSCTFLSLGAGGGSDLFQALGNRATEVHAVEVIPHINHMMLEGDPGGYIVRDSTVSDSAGRLITTPEYTGFLYHDPRVTVVTEDARTYVRRHRNTFDVIFALSSNTWAALASGSFALAENYLFTEEAFKDYWLALTDRGFLSMEHQMYMPRLVSAVLLALEELGIDEPGNHFAVYNFPQLRRNVLLLSKRPLTDEIRTSVYGGVTPDRQETVHLLFPAADSLADNLVNRIVQDGWRAHASEARIDISPTTDDRPFVAQLGKWQNLTREDLRQLERLAEFDGFPLSKLTVVIILLVAIGVTLPLNLLPYFKRGAKLRPVPWLYFFAIGIAFLAVEVVLIQRYTLFIGASLYSIATVLLTLLVAAGLGSRFSSRVADRTAFLGIVAWLLLEVLVFQRVTGALASLPLSARIIVTALLLFPLGFFLGMPFPKAVLRVGDLVDWGFAVNGAASVLGATAALMVALSYGFVAALLCAAAVYLAAYGLLRWASQWEIISP